ncbi:hypothetical protein HID58_043277 [Brassica napus]|uniref:SWIM-type domain-containing protein n=1 Tax=Brassica napus TaxID=3708 RepID=A0ABQ8BG26_BRANA|nr:hypothetical protein HID58_043277 [Brassica napus]
MDNVGWEFVLDPLRRRMLCLLKTIRNMKIFSAWFVKIRWKRPSLLICCLNQHSSDFFSNDIQRASFITLFKTNIIGKKELIMKLRKLSVIERFDFIIKKSWKHLFYAKCFVPGCSWKIRAATIYVTGGDFNCMVDLEKRSCTCKQYDLDKIPCEHAIKWLNVGKLLKLPWWILFTQRATWLKHISYKPYR